MRTQTHTCVCGGDAHPYLCQQIDQLEHGTSTLDAVKEALADYADHFKSVMPTDSDVRLYTCPRAHVYTHMSIHMSIHMSTHMPRHMYRHMPVHISVHMSVHVFMSIFTHMSPHTHLCAGQHGVACTHGHHRWPGR